MTRTSSTAQSALPTITTVPIVTAEVSGEARATLALWRNIAAPAPRKGESLTPLSVELNESHVDYGLRAGDDHTIYNKKRFVPPVTRANIANEVFIQNLVTGPWVHVRSKIFHQGLARPGETVTDESTLVDRFDLPCRRKGCGRHALCYRQNPGVHHRT